MKKIIYSLIASCMFVAPIWYWLTTWWGITLGRTPSLRRFVYIYSNDRTIVIITVVNFVFYAFAMYKIWTMQSGNKRVNVNNNESKNNQNTAGFNALNNIKNVDVSKWENLYGARKNNTVSMQPAMPVSQQQRPQTQVKADVAEMPQHQVSVQAREQDRPVETQRQESVQTQPRSQEASTPNENVVSIAPITANDVYRRQIADMLSDGGYESLGDCMVNGVTVDFMAIAESDTIVVGIINSEYGEIVASDVAPMQDAPSSWYTGEHRYNSPVWEIRNIADEVRRVIESVLPKDNGIEIVPVVVIPNANVINLEDVTDAWQELGVNVVRFLNKTELPDLLDAIPDKEGTEVLESYKTFALTLLKYFKGKNGNKRRVAG